MIKQQELMANYLKDTTLIIKELALSAKKEAKDTKGTEDQDYKLGVAFGFYWVISVMQQQAEAFGIPLKDLNLDDIDADKDLM